MANYKKNALYVWKRENAGATSGTGKVKRKPVKRASTQLLCPYRFNACFSKFTPWELPKSRDRGAIIKPFSKDWIDSWRKVARWHDAEPDRPAGSSISPKKWTSEKFESFVDNDGIDFLHRLHDKKANTNFILSLSVKYLWNETTPEYDYPEWQRRMEWLRAVHMTRYYYMTRTDDDPERVKNVDESLMTLELELADTLEQSDYEIPKHTRLIDTLTSWEVSSDFKPEKKSKSANDKINRFIYTLHHHLVYETKSPQWQLCLDFLRAAGAIKGASVNSPDRLIRPHIEQFVKHHPKESSAIIKELMPTLARWRIEFTS